MNPDEWLLAKQILDTASSLPEGERDDYTRRESEGFPSVYDTCMQMLPFYRNDPTGPVVRYGHVLSDGQLVAGRFRVVRLIAAGGMGEVYEAYDEWLRVRLALKTLRHGQAVDANTLERFKRELLIARGLVHGNLCRVFDFAEHTTTGPTGETAVTPCFTMELLEGETLTDLLNRTRPLPPETVLSIVGQLVSGLAVLHGQNIVHRDLKPSNIMIIPRAGSQPRVVVTDFGLSKPDVAQAGCFESAPDVEIVGAPYFMAPEILRREKASFASDIYALGLVIDEMVTLSRAFSSKAIAGLVFEKLCEKPIPPSLRAQQLPAHWERTILRCIDSDPSTRFSSVTAVLQALEQPELTQAPPLIVAASAPVILPGVAAKSPLLLPKWAWVALPLFLPALFGMAGLSAVPMKTVLVFEMESGKPNEHEYLARGTMSHITERLSKVPGLKVIPAHSSREKWTKAAETDYSLDGTLQLYGGTMRLVLNLSDNVQNGTIFWAKSFDSEEIINPLQLQTRMAESAGAALEKQIAATGGRRSVFLNVKYKVQSLFGPPPAYVEPTQNSQAFDLYMRGHHLLEGSSGKNSLVRVGTL